jgi:pyridoxal phosphate enzyme (YggS family)
MLKYIEENCKEIKSRVEQAAKKAGRKPKEITIIAISKTFSPEAIKAVLEYGIADIGESRIQEAEPKIKSIGNAARWHLVGHLQSNKAKKAVELFDIIQSVDSVKLACMIDENARKINKTIECLIEVNSSGEKSKFGARPSEIIGMIKEITGLKNIILSGLMTVGPLTDDKSEIRTAYRVMYDLFSQGQKQAGASFRYLSMGMSGDFEMAIEESANMVRIGTAIFGER